MSIYDKARKQKFLSFTLIVFTLAVGVLLGTAVQTGVKAKDQSAAPDATPLTIPARSQMQSTFAKIAKELEPSVVNISVEFGPPAPSPQASNRGGGRRQRIQPSNPDNGDDSGSGGSPDDLFRRFFGFGGGNGGIQINPFGGGGEAMPERALGSGVVVDKNGYIITNNHVVEKATKITVKFTNDDTEYPAKVIGTDSETDLAVIHIDRHDLVPAKMGNSDSMQVGDWAMAIGSPLGFEATVTAGIVSALSRDVPEPSEGAATARRTRNSFQHFIQTDAAINPGNSGGPLVDINGEVIGINTMIASESGGYQGIGFAMPSNTAIKVYNSIIREGKMTRGSIGISFTEDPSQTPALLDVYGGVKQGVFVNEVVKGGPAEKAGMKPQDVIVSINGKTIQKGQDLIDIVADSTIGSTLKIGIMRDKKPATLEVVVADRVKTFADSPTLSENSGPGNSTPEGVQKFGISIGALSVSDKQSAGYNGTGSVVIESVDPGSFADGIGLQKEDIILEINRQAVNSPEDVKRIQSTLKAGENVAFHVARQAGNGARGGGSWQPMFLAGRLPAAGSN
jgi:serine protease Do